MTDQEALALFRRTRAIVKFDSSGVDVSVPMLGSWSATGQLLNVAELLRQRCLEEAREWTRRAMGSQPTPASVALAGGSLVEALGTPGRQASKGE